MSFSRLTVAALLAGAFAIVVVDAADARVGGGRNVGSRGERTFKAPPTTNTAPKPAAPVEKSITQPGKSATAQGAQQPAAAAQQASRFGGWRGLLMGGLLAAGLASIFGFGALASVLGFLLQAVLIAGLAYLGYMAFMYFRSRNSGQPALARAAAGSGAAPRPSEPLARSALGSYGGSAAPAALSIGESDFDSFERLLGDIQTAYGREDLDALGSLTTPEMLSYFAQELADNAKQGVRNELGGVKLLQGDLSEAWREQGSDYATVAMRYALTDAMVDRATGRVVSGDRDRPTEATEVWTFRRDDRDRAAGWQLSAIQQA